MRASQRTSDWSPGVGGVGVAQITGSAAAFLGQALTPTSGKITLIRTRGSFLAFLSTVTADLDGFEGAVAIGVASLAAVTAGIASVPTPVAESGWDGWLWHQFFSCRGATAGSLVAVPGALSFRSEIDSKAMRKLDDDDALFAVVEVTEVGNSVIQVALDTRMLFKL